MNPKTHKNIPVKEFSDRCYFTQVHASLVILIWNTRVGNMKPSFNHRYFMLLYLVSLSTKEEKIATS